MAEINIEGAQIAYYLTTCKQIDPRDPKNKEKQRTVVRAIPTQRKKVSFRALCEKVAHATTYSWTEVQGILQETSGIARSLVAEGNSVEIGDFGTLIPSFTSKTAESAEAFNATTHISRARVRLSPSRKYFDLSKMEFMRFDRVDAPLKAKTSKAKATKPEASSPSESETAHSDREHKESL